MCGCRSHQACRVLLARSSSVVMCEREAALHSILGLKSNTLFTSRAHAAKDSWTCRQNRNTLRLALLTRSTSLSRWRKLITQMSSDWPQNCVSLWPWGWAAPPPDRVCYRARESWCLKKQVNVTDPDMQRKGLFKQSMHCLLFIKICTEQCILELTFPYRRQQVQTAVRVQGLQQVPHSLRVGVVELQTQDIRKGS